MFYVLTYAVAVLVGGVQLMLSAWMLLSVIDLKNDYINPVDLCKRVNRAFVPEIGLSVLSSVCFIIMGAWLTAIVSIIPALYQFILFLRKKHFLKVEEMTYRTSSITEARNREVIRVGIYIAQILLYTYGLVGAIVALFSKNPGVVLQFFKWLMPHASRLFSKS